MDFSLTDEQRMLCETARKVGEKYGLDYWRQQDKEKAFPTDFWKEVCEVGIGGITLPEEFGGSNLGMLDMALAIEVLAKGGGGSTIGQLFMLNPIFGGVAINQYGPEAMRAELLPPLISGDLICCMGLTEPDAGTNSIEIKTFAEKSGDGWRLNGKKHWITGTASAQKILVVARTKKAEEVSRRTEGITLFLIDVEREGLTHGGIEKLGTNTLDSSTIFFDDVYIEPHELIASVDHGWKPLLDVLNTERIVTTAGLVGTADLRDRAGGELRQRAPRLRRQADQQLPGHFSSRWPRPTPRHPVRAHDELQGCEPMRRRRALRRGVQPCQAACFTGLRQGHHAGDADARRHGLRQ